MQTGTIVTGLVTLFVLFILAAAFIPQVKSSGDTLQTSIGGSTGKLFGSSGAGMVIPILGIALILAVLAALIGFKLGAFGHGGHK